MTLFYTQGYTCHKFFHNWAKTIWDYGAIFFKDTSVHRCTPLTQLTQFIHNMKQCKLWRFFITLKSSNMKQIYTAKTEGKPPNFSSESLLQSIYWSILMHLRLESYTNTQWFFSFHCHRWYIILTNCLINTLCIMCLCKVFQLHST